MSHPLFSIRTKLITIIAVTLTTFLLFAFFIRNQETEVNFQNTQQKNIAQANNSALNLDIDILRSIVTFNSFLVSPTDTNLKNHLDNRKLVDSEIATLSATSRIPEVQKNINEIKNIQIERRILTDMIISDIQNHKSQEEIQANYLKKLNLDDQIRTLLREIINFQSNEFSNSLTKQESILQKSYTLTAYSFGFVFFVIIILTFAIYWTLVPRINHLIGMATDIKNENFIPESNIKGNDEITLLTKEMNSMGQSLSDKTKSLKASNLELTKFTNTLVDRELKMIELKKEISRLKQT